MTTENVDIVLTEKGGKVVKRSLDDVTESSRKMSNQLTSTQKVGIAVGAAMGTALGGLAVMLFNGFKNAAKAIKDTASASKQLGISVENFSRLDFAARSADLTTSDFVGTVQSLQRAQIEVGKGKEMSKLFKQLGIDAVDTKGKLRETEDVLRDFSALFQKMPDGTNKSALALKVFGTENQKVIELLNGGTEGLDAMAKKSDELGYTLSTKTAQDVKVFYDELDAVKLQVEAMYRQALPGLLPQLKTFSGLLNSQEFKDGFNTIIQGAVNAIIALGKFASTLANVTKFAAETIAAQSGAALDDAPRVDSELTRIEARIKKIQSWEAKGRIGRAFTGKGKADPFALAQDKTLANPFENAQVTAQKELNILTARRSTLLVAQKDNAEAAVAAATAAQKAASVKPPGGANGAPEIDWTALGRTPSGAKGPKGPDPAKAMEQLRRQLDGVLSSINPVLNAEKDLAHAEDVLDKAVAKHILTQDEANGYAEMYKKQLEDQLHPLEAITKGLDEQIRVAGLLGDERQNEQQMLNITAQLQRSSITLTTEKTEALKEQLRVLAEVDKLAAAEENILGASQAKQMEDLARNLQAFQNVKAQLSGKDQFNFLDNLLGGSMSDSQNQFDARAAQLETYYGIVEQFRQKDASNEALAAKAKGDLDAMYLQNRVDQTSAGLGQIAALMGSHNKTAFKIGQAAAIAQVAIDTPTAAIAAYKAMAGIPYIGPFLGAAAAAAVVVQGISSISQIRSQQPPAYRTGGSMVVGGSGGTDSQTVALRATPGERININTPAQARALERAGRQQQQGGAAVQNFSLTVVQQGKADNTTPEQNARALRKVARKMAGV